MNMNSNLRFTVTKVILVSSLLLSLTLAGCGQTTNNQYVYNDDSYETNAPARSQRQTLSGKYRYDVNRDYYFDFSSNGTFEYHGNGVVYQGEYRWVNSEEKYYLECDREDLSGNIEHTVWIATLENGGNTLVWYYQDYPERTFRYSK